MEPGVCEELLGGAAPAAGSEQGLPMLLSGSGLTVEAFVTAVWEAAPLHWQHAPHSTQQERQRDGQRQEEEPQEEAQARRQGQPAPSSRGSSPAQTPLQGLTPAAVFDQLLAGGCHCPVAGDDADPVQSLHELWSQAQLLQPLAVNEDLRLVRAVVGVGAAAAGTTAAAQAAPSGSGSGSGSSGAEPAASEELLAAVPGGASAAEGCAAAHGEGYTSVLRDLPKRWWQAAQLVDAVEQQLGLPAGANLYLTPPGAARQCCAVACDVCLRA
jgi:hypothetical protein